MYKTDYSVFYNIKSCILNLLRKIREKMTTFGKKHLQFQRRWSSYSEQSVCVFKNRTTRSATGLSFMQKCHTKPANVENIVQKRHNENKLTQQYGMIWKCIHLCYINV